MKKKNVKDDLLRMFASLDVPKLTKPEILQKVEYDKGIIDFAILELEKNNYIAILAPSYKGDFIHYLLTQDGEIFITTNSYFKTHQETVRKNLFKFSDKLITILGILTGIIFGVNSCSTKSKNEKLIILVEKKDSIINQKNNDINRFSFQLDNIKNDIIKIKRNNENSENDIKKLIKNQELENKKKVQVQRKKE